MTELFIATGNSFASVTQSGYDWTVQTELRGKGV
jgi:hypothetical protein